MIFILFTGQGMTIVIDVRWSAMIYREESASLITDNDMVMQ